MKTRDFIYSSKTTKIMKTGGTMNFLKRAGAILMVVAIFASSCNKYADDFKQLNTKMDALAEQVKGVTSLVTDMSTVKSQIAAIQTAVAGLPTTASITALSTSLSTVNGKIDALATTLNTVAATGTATAATVTQLQTDLATLTAKVTTDNKTMGDNITLALSKLTDLGTSVSGISSKVNDLTTNLAILNTKATDLQTAVASNSTAIQAVADQVTAQAVKVQDVANQITALAAQTNDAAVAAAAQAVVDAAAAKAQSDAILAQIAIVNNALAAAAQTGTAADATAATIMGLQAMLNAQKLQLDQILANTSMYTGSVSILTDTDVDFFMLKLAQMSVINGTLTVNPALVTKMTDLNTILKKITAVVGSNAVNITASATAAKAMDLSNLSSVSGNLTITGGNLITQSACNLSKLSSVGGNFAYSLDGAIDLPMLSGVGGTLTITPYTTTGTTVVGTTQVNLPLANVTGVINAASITLPSATKVVMPATGLTTLSAVNATELTVVNTTDATGGLTITPKSTAVVTLSFTKIVGAAALTIANGTTVNLANLATAAVGSSLSVTTVAAGTVNLEKFNADIPVTIIGSKTASLPLWAGGAVASTLVAASAETISLPAHTWSWGGGTPTAGNWAAVKSLTVGAVNAAITVVPYTTLTTLSVTGKTVTTWATLLATLTTTGANSALKTVTIAGMWKTVDLTGLTAMTSLTTTGSVVNGFTISGATNAALTAITLDHSVFTSSTDGTPGGILNVVNNTVATSLTVSALDKITSLAITGNTALKAISFPALATLANTGAGTSISVAITGNAFRGAFTAAIAAVAGVSPYVEAVINCSELAKLKAYMNLATGASGYATKTYNIVYNNDNTTPFAAFNLPAAMTANDATSAAIDQTAPANGIDVATELAILQP
ncbi:MAG: hypothetical protein M0Q53_07800 [Prolixibacteraceae bacterium]|jgi:predicted  nucleic acid-binding Zn-ribbon protein|nr:hypothetical protein [Prolixibacteraceae bacterium]